MGGGNDADAQAFITAASITDSTQQSAINTLVTQLKGYGIWTKMKALYPFVGGSASQHKFNLKDPRDLDAAYRLVFNGGGVHSSTGYQLNGSNSWADTKLIPSNILSSNGKVSLGFYSRTNRTGANRVVMGSYTNPTSGFMIYPRYTDNKAYFGLADDSNGNPPSVTSTLGFYQGARNNSTTQSLSNINGNNYSYNYNTTSLPNTSVFIGTINYYPSTYVDNLELAFSYVGEDLSAGDMSNYYTAVQTFQTTLGRNVGAPIVADSDAQAFLNAAEITSQTQANAIDVLVTDLKSANIWTKMKALYPFVGGTASAHKFNLKDPRDLDAAYRLVFNGGWTHSSSGAQPNGTTAFADTKLIPSSTLNLNSTHLSVYLNTNFNSTSGTDVVDMGVEDASFTNRLFIEPSSGGNVYSINNSNGASFVVTPDSNSLGLYVNNRISSTAINLFKNNIKLINDTARTSSALSVRPLYIGAHNFVGSASYLSPRRQAFASIGDSLTDTEALAFYTAVQKYQTSLGRQV